RKTRALHASQVLYMDNILIFNVPVENVEMYVNNQLADITLTKKKNSLFQHILLTTITDNTTEKL
ncbi:MAG: hypothetical protein IJ413_11705, partial [Bacteroides sp.]|nr:hypothetical protein [Bacteroides sp.]